MADPRKISFTALQAGRLDSVLGSEASIAAELEGFSRSQAENYIKEGRVEVNKRIVTKPSFKVTVGDTLIVAVPEPVSLHAPLERDLDIYYEDSSLLVVNKPAGLTVHPGAGNSNTTLLNALVHHYKKSKTGLPQIFVESLNERVGIVHRLDKDTSGLLVVAKTLTVLQALQKQFHDHTVEREYVALCLTTPRASGPLSRSEEGTIEGGLRRRANNRKAFELVPSKDGGGKYSKTNWKVLERFTHGLLVSCRLATGRTHQIRVHLTAAGFPIAGDTTYGDASYLPKVLALASERLGRQALHARTLGFVHPISGESLSFSAPLPIELQEVIALFRQWRG